MAGRLDPSHDRAHLPRDELRVLARLERSSTDDEGDARSDGGAEAEDRSLSPVRSRFRKGDGGGGR